MSTNPKSAQVLHLSGVDDAKHENIDRHSFSVVALRTDSAAFLCALAGFKTERTTPAKIPMITITIRSSIKVNEDFWAEVNFMIYIKTKQTKSILN
ncbi:hypothetical protein A2982_02595 [candidate division WWE3 bacterium RIFCSPLOWO2_01_FULL_39_13]|uniref:Uncharacterized protein n=1 Tax=candidate division WWE3 bacterium RIFCSPLOWO2_01_FULL_39_13 TaxID=1802624 RepID=A0A1F4V2K7_UNCKA|nr:MAG: hypothetical protein A2982_02595 [candidate division WWE3 bacterium RIFCSPLOWO2_01_FULL_39_13]